MAWFNKNSIEAELREALISHENTKEKLSKVLEKVDTLKDELKDKKHKIEELDKKLADKKYDQLYLLPGGEQGDLLKRLINRHQAGHEVSFENLSCIGMYLADRHSTIYELVNRIVLENAAIKYSHFENACFDNVTFKNVVFNNDCFYKAFFEDVQFKNCIFIDCDFTASRGYNVTFENCTQQNTDISKIEIKEAELESENPAEFDDMIEIDDEEELEFD